ncbi:hypothetical protein Shyhy01_19200 [Streptomyces hygroscopicus subsp. hygroscopicus]|nr:hypothetical protein [Streptomyces hygroscopicus]GLX48970.1 hypothetical protein Shyhy01_19200 [Streptomyces hygroscopicus subsp. hygroscopicus]
MTIEDVFEERRKIPVAAILTPVPVGWSPQGSRRASTAGSAPRRRRGPGDKAPFGGDVLFPVAQWWFCGSGTFAGPGAAAAW